MVAGVKDIATAAIDKAVCAAIVSEVINIGFVPCSLRQLSFAIVEVVAANHHAERRERIEIPFGKIATGFLLVESFAFAFGDVV